MKNINSHTRIRFYYSVIVYCVALILLDREYLHDQVFQHLCANICLFPEWIQGYQYGKCNIALLAVSYIHLHDRHGVVTEDVHYFSRLISLNGVSGKPGAVHP